MEKIVNWVIDKDLYGDYLDKLTDAITASGMKFHIFDELKEYSFSTYMYKNFKDEIIMLHGSLEQGEFMYRNGFHPGAYADTRMFDCSKYYGHYGSYLTNLDYVMFPLIEVYRNHERLFNLFKTDKMFIRPNSAMKTFSGQILSLANFKEEFEALLKWVKLDPCASIEDLVVVAPYKKIINEWRFIVVNKEIISGSLYMNEDSRKTNTPLFDRPCEWHSPPARFAEALARMYNPSTAYMLDVAQTEDGFGLLEINTFSCSNMYGANYLEVVKSINKAAIASYESMFEEDQE